jgi:hypothetical protein
MKVISFFAFLFFGPVIGYSVVENQKTQTMKKFLAMAVILMFTASAFANPSTDKKTKPAASHKTQDKGKEKGKTKPKAENKDTKKETKPKK